MKAKHLLTAFCFCSLMGCATIPPESVTLIDQISLEGQRMHDINLGLVTNLIEEKKHQVDSFIEGEYTSTLIGEMQKNAPAGTDWKAEFPDIMKAAVPEITKKRNELHAALDSAEQTIVGSLNEDFVAYQTACSGLQQLLVSSAHLNGERKALLAQSSKLVSKKIDIDEISAKLDAFLLKAGEVSGQGAALHDELNQLLTR